MIQDLAFDCSSYEEYCRAYDTFYPEVKEEEPKPKKDRKIRITYPDGHVADVSSTAITIEQLMDAHDAGAEIDL